MEKYKSLYLRELQDIVRDKSLLDNLNKLSNDQLEQILKILNNPVPKPTYLLSGVRKFGYYKHKKLDKYIYILYDQHTSDGICRKNKQRKLYTHTDTASDWILQAIASNSIAVNKNKNSSVIDIFIETRDISGKFERQNIIPGMYGLHNISSKLYYCLHPNRSTDMCQYKNIRSHWVDVRHNFRLDYIMWKLRNIIITNRGSLTKKEYDYIEYNIFRNPIEYIEKVMRLPRIKKQLDNIKDNEITSKLKNFIFSMLQTAKITYDINSKNKNRKDRIIDDMHMILTVHILTMDTYLLARLFRNFNVKGIKNSYPSAIKKSIIFAGGIHATNYELFLQQLGFEEVFSVGNFTSDFSDIVKYMNGDNPFSKNKESQCLDISKIPEPLFT